MARTSPVCRSRAQSTARSRWLAWSHSGGRASRASHAAAAAARMTNAMPTSVHARGEELPSRTGGSRSTSTGAAPVWTSAIDRGADHGQARVTLGRREPARLVSDRPHRLLRRGVVGAARNQVPVDVTDLIAEQLVVHLHRAERRGQPARHPADLLDQLRALGGLKLPEL